jgi:hypothetical protein
MNDEFYIGYLPRAPRSLGRRIAWLTGWLAVAALGVAALVAFGQAPFANSKFEFGIWRDYSGWIEQAPYPALRTARGTFLLVAPGKHGFTAPNPPAGVTLRASLIERGSNRMLEVQPDSIHAATPARPRPDAAESLGQVVLRGEIVDSKCFLGVMNPGNGQVHGDCAVRCISGGIPPAFAAPDASGRMEIVLLAGSDDRQLNKEVLPWVAQHIEISGELIRTDSLLLLRTEPSRFRRLPE